MGNTQAASTLDKGTVQGLFSAGWQLFRNVDLEGVEQTARDLGTVINAADVKVTPGTRSLVNSDKGLGCHTDHHRADIVILYCVRQTDQGGETFLVDGYRALQAMAAPDIRELSTIRLFEHRVFPNDPSDYPLLRRAEGGWELYYSFWLVKADLSPTQRSALHRFREHIESLPRHTFRLVPGDALGFLNKRMLHGRTRIAGSKDRHLKRFWIQFEKEQRHECAAGHRTDFKEPDRVSH